MPLQLKISNWSSNVCRSIKIYLRKKKHLSTPINWATSRRTSFPSFSVSIPMRKDPAICSLNMQARPRRLKNCLNLKGKLFLFLWSSFNQSKGSWLQSPFNLGPFSTQDWKHFTLEESYMGILRIETLLLDRGRRIRGRSKSLILNSLRCTNVKERSVGNWKRRDSCWVSHRICEWK